MADTVWTMGWRVAGMLLVTAAAHAGEVRTTLGADAHAAAGAEPYLPAARLDLPEVRLGATGASLGWVAPAASPSLASRAVGADFPEGVEVRLSAAFALPGGTFSLTPGRAVEGDAYDVFLAFFLNRTAPAAEPRSSVVQADRPGAVLARLAGL